VTKLKPLQHLHKLDWVLQFWDVWSNFLATSGHTHHVTHEDTGVIRMNKDTYFESGEAEEVVGWDQQWTFGGFLRGHVSHDSRRTEDRINMCHGQMSQLHMLHWRIPLDDLHM
jgi:hypothetical protein